MCSIKVVSNQWWFTDFVSGKKVLGLSSDQNMASYNKSDRSHRSDKQGCFTISSQGIFKVIFFNWKFSITFINQYLISILRSPGRFYARLVEHEKDKKNTPTDVYIWMLGVDFICFIIIMFGYWAFGKHNEEISGDITVEIKENVVPTSFLYLLFTHFFLILIGTLWC